jgi:hypothetical protein
LLSFEEKIKKDRGFFSAARVGSFSILASAKIPIKAISLTSLLREAGRGFANRRLERSKIKRQQ